jgi:hypothetical protein
LAAKELAVASRQRTVSNFLFHQGIFYQNNMTVFPHLSCFSVSLNEDKTEKPPFSHNIEVIEAELQAMLYSLIERDFQDALKKDRSAENCACLQKGTISRMMVASIPKLARGYRQSRKL